MSLMVMIKRVYAALKAEAWTFEAEATGCEAKALKFGLEDYSVSKKTGLLHLTWHNFTNSQHSVIYFDTETPYSILHWLR